jgi:hypothetical protein
MAGCGLSGVSFCHSALFADFQGHGEVLYKNNYKSNTLQCYKSLQKKSMHSFSRGITRGLLFAHVFF